MKRGTCAVLFVALLFVAMALSSHAQSASVNDLLKQFMMMPFGGCPEVPDFELPALDGGATLRFSELRGNTVLLNFWAFWCMPCRIEMPSLNKLHQEMEKMGKPFVLVAISVDSNRDKEKIKSFMEENDYNFMVLLDPDMRVSRDIFQVRALPTTFIIGKNGELLAGAMGARDWSDEQFIKLIDDLSENPCSKVNSTN